jgi:peptide/nickel transport system substrate-binding protein
MKGGTLTIGVDAVPPTIDQAVYPGQSARWAHIQYEATLLMYKPLPRDATTLQDPTKLTGNLATSWTVSPDGITVKLRKAKASNGDVLTAKDVAWTFDREVALKDGVGEFYLGLAGINPDKPVTVVNNNTVKFNGHITPLGLVPLMADQFAIIDSKQAKAHATHSDPWATDWLKTHSAGYGPYDVSSFQPKQKLTLTANPNYWHGPPGYNKVVMTPTTVQTAPQLLRSGTIEYQIEVGLAQFAKLKKQGSLKMYAAPSLSQDVLELNKKSGPLANVNVRRAMSMAINRKALVQGPYHRVGKPAVSVINTSIPGITGTSPYYSYDLKKAKSLLATTPYKDGFTLNLTATQAEVSSVDISSLAVNLASQLAPLGIKVKVNTIASDADFTAARKADKLQAWLRKESPAVADAVYLMQLIHVTGANSNYTHESNPAIDALVKKASVQEFGPARNKPINKAVALWNKKMPDIPLVQLKNTFGFAKSVCGIAPSSTQEISASTLHPC